MPKESSRQEISATKPDFKHANLYEGINKEETWRIEPINMF